MTPAGGNITNRFEPAANVANASLNVTLQSGGVLRVKGKGFYVGYVSDNVVCKRIKDKTIILPKGQNLFDEELGLYAKIIDYRKDGDVEEALVYLRASNFLTKEIEDLGELSQKLSELYDSIHKSSHVIALSTEEARAGVDRATNELSDSKRQLQVRASPSDDAQGKVKEAVRILEEVENEHRLTKLKLADAASQAVQIKNQVDSIDPWLKAFSPSTPERKDVVVGESPFSVRVRFGVPITIPVKSQRVALYIETTSLGQEEVRFRVERLELSVEK